MHVQVPREERDAHGIPCRVERQPSPAVVGEIKAHVRFHVHREPWRQRRGFGAEDCFFCVEAIWVAGDIPPFAYS